MLSPTMKAYITQKVKEQLTETCKIEKPGSTTNEIGGGKASWLPVATVPCRVINNLRGQEAMIGDQPSDQWDMTLITLSEVELQVGYRVTFGNEVYFVKAIKGHLTQAVDQQATIGKKR